jgi:hypothetical protein
MSEEKDEDELNFETSILLSLKSTRQQRVKALPVEGGLDREKTHRYLSSLLNSAQVSLCSVLVNVDSGEFDDCVDGWGCTGWCLLMGCM